ncbi:MAG: hypothetical protein HYZ93_05850 [Candidatus Omnitrophica bacterium]|nr:hypothetical protein [Candidatus Omnitrophota bacterium]
MVKERGAALITAIILLLFLGSIGASLSSMVYSRLLAVNLEVDRLQAQYLAEAGIAQGLYEIKTGLDVFGGGRGSIPVTVLGPGLYKVDQDPKSSTLVAIGVVRDVRRVIVTKYE